MQRVPAHQAIAYTAIIEGVWEVSLWGTADLSFWRNVLQPEELSPYSYQGRAELALTATSLTWKGLRFRELVITVAISTHRAAARRDGFFLAQAFNSSRLLALAERRLFKTPYDHAAIHVPKAAPSHIQLWANRQAVFQARKARLSDPVAKHPEEWRGPIFLPQKMTPGKPGHTFFVVLSGDQTTYPVSPLDRIEIRRSAAHPIFQQLIESNFTAVEWRIRASAKHAKSKTYPRDFGAEVG